MSAAWPIWSLILLTVFSGSPIRARCHAMECDCAAANYATNKADLAAELDARIRAHLEAGRSPEAIYRLEAGGSILRPRIERWANEHREAARPDRSRLKYRGAPLPETLAFSCIDSSIRLGGICVGADKLGHFFQQGWEGYRIAELEGRGDAVARAYAEWLEGIGSRDQYAVEEAYFLQQPSGRLVGYGGFGRNISGVLSHADVAASCAGVRFYRDLAAGRFRTVRDYVTANWCEEINPNEYTESMRRYVDRNTSSKPRTQQPVLAPAATSESLNQ